MCLLFKQLYILDLQDHYRNSSQTPLTLYLNYSKLFVNSIITENHNPVQGGGSRNCPWGGRGEKYFLRQEAPSMTSGCQMCKYPGSSTPPPPQLSHFIISLTLLICNHYFAVMKMCKDIFFSILNFIYEDNLQNRYHKFTILIFFHVKTLLYI